MNSHLVEWQFISRSNVTAGTILFHIQHYVLYMNDITNIISSFQDLLLVPHRTLLCILLSIFPFLQISFFSFFHISFFIIGLPAHITLAFFPRSTRSVNYGSQLRREKSVTFISSIRIFHNKEGKAAMDRRILPSRGGDDAYCILWSSIYNHPQHSNDGCDLVIISIPIVPGKAKFWAYLCIYHITDALLHTLADLSI